MMLVEDLILFFNLSSQSRHKFESIVYCITPLDKMSLSIIGKKNYCNILSKHISHFKIYVILY